jgi:putative nucleotidyltransferase with HDIG domain
LSINYEHYSILVVDDEKVILEILRDFLTLEGFKVTSAIAGEDAMELMHKDYFDLLITDLKMPGITGLDLLKHVTEKFPHTVTIVMTGFGTLETAIDAMKSGAYDYILKPFKVDEVVHIVKRGLEKKRLEEENIQLKETISLYNASEAINSSLSLDDILHLLLETACNLVRCDLGALYLKNWKSNTFELKRHRKTEMMPDIKGLEKMPLDKLLENHKKKIPVIAANEDISGLSVIPKDFKNQIHSFCSVPLKLKDRIIGMLNIYSCSTKEKITEGQRKTLSLLADRAAFAIENATLYSNLQQHFFQTIDSFLKVIEAKDPYTHGHSERVRKYSEMMAKELKIDPNAVKIISQAALLHDIGKIGVDLSDLNHPGSLDVNQRNRFKLHPTIAVNILEPISLLGPVIPIIKHHHENYDGTGYPDGISAENIPMGARIIAIADSFDAMTSDRAYRKALSTEMAANELIVYAGKQFDPKLVDIFMKLLKKERP